MSSSLKDQLLALGLAQNKTKPKREKQHKPRPAKTKSKDGSFDISLDQAYRIRNEEERKQKKLAVALKREQERRRREVNQKIKALISTTAIRDKDADIKRNFIFKGRIRSVLATREQLIEINNGSLGVVYLSGNYHLIPAEFIDEIRQFAPENIPDLAGAEPEGEEDNPVPDDLIW